MEFALGSYYRLKNLAEVLLTCNGVYSRRQYREKELGFIRICS